MDRQYERARDISPGSSAATVWRRSTGGWSRSPTRTRRCFPQLEIHREDRYVRVQGVANLAVAVRRCDRRFRDEVQDGTGVIQRRGDLLAPDATATYSLVVPKVEAVVLEPVELFIDPGCIVVRIAHEHTGFIAFCMRGKVSPTRHSCCVGQNVRDIGVEMIVAGRTSAVSRWWVATVRTDDGTLPFSP